MSAFLHICLDKFCLKAFHFLSYSNYHTMAMFSSLGSRAVCKTFFNLVTRVCKGDHTNGGIQYYFECQNTLGRLVKVFLFCKLSAHCGILLSTFVQVPIHLEFQIFLGCINSSQILVAEYQVSFNFRFIYASLDVRYNTLAMTVKQIEFIFCYTYRFAFMFAKCISYI